MGGFGGGYRIERNFHFCYIFIGDRYITELKRFSIEQEVLFTNNLLVQAQRIQYRGGLTFPFNLKF